MSDLNSVVAQLADIASTLKSIDTKMSGGGGGGGGGAGAAAGAAAAAAAPFVAEFDDLVANVVQPYVDAANKVGEDTAAQAKAVLAAFAAQRAFLTVASASKKPKDSDLPKLLEATSKAMGDVGAFKDNRKKLFNNLAMVAEGIQALGWVTISPAPAPFIGEMIGASDMYGNKVLMEFRGKDENHVNMVKAWKLIITELQAYVKKNHTTGVTWNPKGGEASAAAPAAAPAAGGPPGPPPPMKKDLLAGISPSSGGAPAASSGGGGASAVFAQLNSGNVTSGLKKVTKDMKSKNQEGYTGAVKAPVKSTVSKFDANLPTQPPVFQLDGNKWKVENQVDNQGIEITETEVKQTLYAYKCVGKTARTIIQVKGPKINAVTLDACIKTSVVVNSVLASVDIVNCKNVEVQILGKAATIAIDKTSGCTLYLSDECREATIVTGMSSEINVVLPPPAGKDDPLELPIAEQFVTTIKGNELVTVCMEHKGD